MFTACSKFMFTSSKSQKIDGSSTTSIHSFQTWQVLTFTIYISIFSTKMAFFLDVLQIRRSAIVGRSHRRPPTEKPEGFLASWDESTSSNSFLEIRPSSGEENPPTERRKLRDAHFGWSKMSFSRSSKKLVDRILRVHDFLRIWERMKHVAP